MRIRAFARGAGLAIVFALMVFVVMAAVTEECAADENTSTFYVECGEGHEEAAKTIEQYFSDPGFAYKLDNIVQNGTSVSASCSSLLRISQMKARITDALMGGWTSDDKFYIDNNKHELIWRDSVGLKPLSKYQDKKQLDDENRNNTTTTIGDIPNCTFYLLWEKPYDKSIEVSIDTPYCKSTEAPTVKSDTVTLSPSREPVWYSTLPDNNPNYPWVGKYTGVLEGGEQYYACAELAAPWGYYFPKGFSDVSVEFRSCDVWDATNDDEYENLNVGCWVTAGHIWSDKWSVTEEPTCSAEGVESRPCTQGCGTFDTRPIDIDPNAHSWGAWTTVKKATALNAGQQQRVCAHDASHIEKRSLPATGVKGLLLAQMKSGGKTKLNLTWTKVTGAEGYDIFFAKCNSNETKSKYKYAKSIKGNKTFSWTKSGLKKNTSYKAYVKAWAYKNGKKTYVRTSPGVHAFTSGGSKKYTNPKSVTVAKASVTLKKGGTFKIKGKVNKLSAKKKLPDKGHGTALRYYTSNKAIATVSSAGKITAKGKGKCTVYALSISGVRKAVAVTVK